MGNTGHHSFGRPYSSGADVNKPQPLAELSFAAFIFGDILFHSHNTISMRRDLKYTDASYMRSGLIFISFCYDPVRRTKGGA